MIRVAITTLGAMPYPNHSTNRGAKAKTGTAWLTTRIGISHCRAGRK